MLRKPVPVTKNSLLKAVQIQRKSKEPIHWVILGVMRDNVPPTALIIEESLITEKGWYEPHEFDVIERVVSYQILLELYRLKNQAEVVDTLYNKAIKWQNYRRNEREALQHEPIRALLTKLELTEYTTHYKGNTVLHKEVDDFSEGEYSIDYLLHTIDNYAPICGKLDGSDERVKEDRTEILYRVKSYNRLTGEYDIYNVFKLEAKVGELGLNYKTIKFTWLLPEDKFGIKGNSYLKDPVYQYIQSRKGGR